MVGRKNDSGKIRYDLLPVSALYEIARVLTKGSLKYAPNNYLFVENGRARYTAAGWRHLAKHMRGELLDSEWDLLHLAHAGCCMFMIGALDHPAQDCHPTTGDGVRMDLIPFAVLDSVVGCYPLETERPAEDTLGAWTSYCMGTGSLELCIAHLLNWISQILEQHKI